MIEEPEEWKVIDGFNGVYSISSYGRVRSKGFLYRDKMGRTFRRGGGLLRGSIGTKGYTLVKMRESPCVINEWSIHRLVATCFIPNPNNLPEVNHKDGNPRNNHKSNLEWCDQSQNMHHSYYVLGKKGVDNRPIKQLSLTGDLIKVWSGVNAAARGLGKSSNSGIHLVLRGKRPTMYGFKWTYGN